MSTLYAGWDCHAHVFGPYARFPLATERSDTPPEATLDMFDTHLDRLGLEHGVLVHPSAYGSDLSLLMHALARRPKLRGVIVAKANARLAFPALRDRGVRALRFSHRSGSGTNFLGSATFSDMTALAPAMADAALHAELWTDCAALPAIAHELRRFPVPVVIDHMGGFDALAGVDEPGFETLRTLIAEGHVRVKLVAYRNLLPLGDALSERGEVFVRALVEANPACLLWGSDWPHLRVAPPPDATDLMAKIRAWIGDERTWHQILNGNAAALYE